MPADKPSRPPLHPRISEGPASLELSRDGASFLATCRVKQQDVVQGHHQRTTSHTTMDCTTVAAERY